MLTMDLDYNKLAKALAPELCKEMHEQLKDAFRTPELPPLLTVNQLMELFHIKRWKASELMGRPDFPVIREAGVLIHRDKLFEWIDRHTQWVEDNTGYFKVS